MIFASERSRITVVNYNLGVMVGRFGEIMNSNSKMQKGILVFVMKDENG